MKYIIIVAALATFSFSSAAMAGEKRCWKDNRLKSVVNLDSGKVVHEDGRITFANFEKVSKIMKISAAEAKDRYEKYILHGKDFTSVPCS